MRILITNDDGIHAEGIHHLWQALRDFGDVFIVAPAEEHSGAGLSVSARRPLYLKENVWEGNANSWSLTGTPADCVKFAISHLKLDIDLVVSGINCGSNAGRNLLYSGTVGGVIEGCFRGIPGIAFSYAKGFPEDNHENFFPWVQQLVRYVQEHPIPGGMLFNVNFPQHPKGIRFARQGKGFWMEDIQETKDKDGNKHYYLGCQHAVYNEVPDSDVRLLGEGLITVVPAHVDELTHHSHYDEYKYHIEEFFENQKGRAGRQDP